MSYQEGINKDQTVTTTLDLPNAVQDLVATLAADTRFGAFSRLIEATPLREIWKGSSWTTLLAPTDDALARAAKENRLPDSSDTDEIQRFLERHAIRGYLKEADLKTARNAKTLGGLTVSVMREDGRTRVNGATLIAADIPCNNGIIHALDSMLAPE